MAWISRCCGSGVGQRLQLIRPLAWEPPYAAGAAPEKAKRHTQKKLIPHVKSHGSFIISAQGFESASWQSTAGDGIKDCTATGWVKTEDPPWGGPRYGVVVGRGKGVSCFLSTHRIKMCECDSATRSLEGLWGRAPASPSVKRQVF